MHICLSILAPPSSIEIEGYSHNAKVEVRENQDLTLKCVVSNAKPAAQIIWYRGNIEYKPGKFNKMNRTNKKGLSFVIYVL